ncbi:MAG: oligosaccharide flippase family protein [Gallionella sp.]|nr:oligosaccharide flippase family protein [Gallionella sp.]
MKKHSLLGSSAIYLLTSFVASAIPFLLLPVLTRYLDTADYGVVTMFGLWQSVLGVFVGLSVQGAIGVRYFDRETIDMQRYVSSCIFILIISTVLTLCGVYIFSSYLERYTALIRDWLLIGVLITAMQFLISIRLSLWQVSGYPKKYGFMQIAQGAINAGLSLMMVVVAGLTWEGRLGAISVAVAMTSIFALKSLWNEGWLTTNINFDYVKNALAFGMPLIPHVLGGMFLSLTDRVLLTNLIGIDAAGIYAVALQIGMIVSLATMAFNQAYAPWLYEQLKKTNKQLNCRIVRYTYLYFAAVTVVALLIGICAPLIMSVMVGNQFQDGAEVVIYVALGFAFGGMYFMVTNYVFFAGYTGKLAINTFFVGVINVMLTFLLIEKNGIVGAGQGFMLSQALLFLGTWRIALRAYPMPWWTFWKDTR